MFKTRITVTIVVKCCYAFKLLTDIIYLILYVSVRVCVAYKKRHSNKTEHNSAQYSNSQTHLSYKHRDVYWVSLLLDANARLRETFIIKPRDDRQSICRCLVLSQTQAKPSMTNLLTYMRVLLCGDNPVTASCSLSRQMKWRRMFVYSRRL